MSDPTEARRRYAALLAAELRLARPEVGTIGVLGELARELRPALRLFRDRFGESPEAAAVFRAEIARALFDGDETLVAAALGDIGSGRPHATGKARPVPWGRLWTEVVVGCALLGIGLVIGFVAAQATLSCQRSSSAPRWCTVSCRLQWHVLFGSVPVRDTAIECLGAAEHVRTETTGETSTNVYYRVMLSARDGTERYAMNTAGGHEPTFAATKRIQDFLAAPDQSSLRVVLVPAGRDRWLTWLGDGLLVLGLITVLAVPVQIVRSWSNPAPADSSSGSLG